jgi:hypothetical protein
LVFGLHPLCSRRPPGGCGWRAGASVDVPAGPAGPHGPAPQGQAALVRPAEYRGPVPDLDPPEPGAADWAHTVVKAAVSGVPYVGGPAAELFGMIIPASLERRRQEWFERVGERLRRLEEEGVHVDPDDEGFITIVVEATKAALGTHIEEKLEPLANCIQSAALPEPRDDFMAMRLLLYVEEHHQVVGGPCKDALHHGRQLRGADPQAARRSASEPGGRRRPRRRHRPQAGCEGLRLIPGVPARAGTADTTRFDR